MAECNGLLDKSYFSNIRLLLQTLSFLDFILLLAFLLPSISFLLLSRLPRFPHLGQVCVVLFLLGSELISDYVLLLDFFLHLFSECFSFLVPLWNIAKLCLALLFDLSKL